MAGDRRPQDGRGHLAIEMVGVCKAYGQRVALHELSLEVRRREVFGFLGPNGAGKTTAVKVMLGLARPTSGAARVWGRPVADPAVRRRVGYLPERFAFPGWMTGHALLDLHARLTGLSAARGARASPPRWSRWGWRAAVGSGWAAIRRACASASAWPRR